MQDLILWYIKSILFNPRLPKLLLLLLLFLTRLRLLPIFFFAIKPPILMNFYAKDRYWPPLFIDTKKSTSNPLMTTQWRFNDARVKEKQIL